MITDEVCRSVAEYGISHGADFVEIFGEHTVQHGVSLVNNETKNLIYTEICGVGIRVISGGKVSYAYTNSISEDSLYKMIRNMVENVFIGESDIKYGKPTNELCNLNEFCELSNKDRLNIISEISRPMISYSPKIRMAGIEYFDSNQDIVICNSEGVLKRDRRYRTRCTIKSVASDKGETHSCVKTIGKSDDFNYWNSLDLNNVGRSVAETSINMLGANNCPSGVFPVVISNGFGGVLIHEACGHSLESNSIVRNCSEYTESLGNIIASNTVTLIDDGTINGAWGSMKFDDEGYDTQKTVLIKKGVLNSYMTDRIGAIKLGHHRTGNARRENYTFMPTSRMTNTYIDSCNEDESELFSEITEGLYVANVGGGSVNTLSGEFNFSVAEGYWIKNGIVQYPIKGATLIGKGKEVLMNIEKVGKDVSLGQGMCIAKSGKIPVSVGQPSIRIKEMIVGGIGKRS